MHKLTAELIDDYLTTFGRSKNTLATYRSSLAKFARVAGDDAELTIENYVKFLKSIKKQSPSTQNVRKTAVMGLYVYYEAVEFAKLEKQNDHYLTKFDSKRPVNYNEEQLDKFISYCNGLSGDLDALRDKAFVLTLGDTGLRISEACALKRGDIDLLNERSIIVGKGDKTAMVRFSKISISAIKAYHEARQDGAGNKSLNSLPVFAAHKSKKDILPITSDGMRKHFRKRMDEAGVPKKAITPHTLRHYFVTQILLGTGNIKTAQELARHESISVTQRYAHLANAELDQKYDEVFNQNRRPR